MASLCWYDSSEWPWAAAVRWSRSMLNILCEFMAKQREAGRLEDGGNRRRKTCCPQTEDRVCTCQRVCACMSLCVCILQSLVLSGMLWLIYTSDHNQYLRVGGRREKILFLLYPYLFICVKLSRFPPPCCLSSLIIGYRLVRVGKAYIQVYSFSSINLVFPAERDETASYRAGMGRQRDSHISYQQYMDSCSSR